jgi:glycosyltransferase EpsE
MNKSPLVSVMMAIYNCEETLEEAIKCIINQTYLNWELILYDDCSTDNTYNKALEIAKTDSRIKVYKNEKNLTLAPTLNNCLHVAKGEYVARMDGDDICDVARFEKEVSFLTNNQEYAVVSCQMYMYDENGIYANVAYPEYPVKENLASYSPLCHAGSMMRKSVLEELKGYNISSEVERIEDYDLWVRLYENGYKAYNIQEYLYSMRNDRNAIKRKKYKFRISEYKLKKKACKIFNLSIKYRLQAYRPLILGLMPSFTYKILQRIKHKG